MDIMKSFLNVPAPKEVREAVASGKKQVEIVQIPVSDAKDVKRIAKSAIDRYRKGRSDQEMINSALSRIENDDVREKVMQGMILPNGEMLPAEDLERLYAPILTEMQMDFIFRHFHDNDDQAARNLAHKLSEKIIDRYHRTEDAGENGPVGGDAAETISNLNRLLKITDQVGKSGLSIEELIAKVSYGDVPDAEIMDE